ncbi:LysM peptidoglycan-binding domain-containing protein [Ligilactobacillus salivarius]|nr:LysM peptidoglycan-binding domain-containing protein [Ligilactobacillus salivarius]
MKLNKTLLSLTAATGIIATGAAANGAKADKITVKSGDTVSQLALDHATTVDNVQQLNNLENVDLIFVGQTLEMGDGSYTTTTYQTASQYQQNYAQNTDA